MAVAHRRHGIDRLDGDQLRPGVEQERPRVIGPEVEAIATDILITLEAEGWGYLLLGHPTSSRCAEQVQGRL